MDLEQIRIPRDVVIDLSGKSIEVIVGSEPPVIHSVHEGLICARSGFFKTAMKTSWSKGDQRLIHLPEDDPDIFLIYLHWLYTSTIPTRIDAPNLEGNAEYVQLAKAYVLGDKLQDSTFQDVVLDMIVDKCRSTATDGRHWHPVGEAVQYIYENTVATSKARCLLVDIYVAHGSARWLHDYMGPQDTPKDFFLDIAAKCLDKIDNDPTLKSSLCEYHEHDLGVGNCYRTRFNTPRNPRSSLDCFK